MPDDFENIDAEENPQYQKPDFNYSEPTEVPPIENQISDNEILNSEPVSTEQDKQANIDKLDKLMESNVKVPPISNNQNEINNAISNLKTVIHKKDGSTVESPVINQPSPVSPPIDNKVNNSYNIDNGNLIISDDAPEVTHEPMEAKANPIKQNPHASTLEVEGFMPMLNGSWNNFRNLFNQNVSDNVYATPKDIPAKIAAYGVIPIEIGLGTAAAIAALPFELPIVGGGALASSLAYGILGGASYNMGDTLLDHYERLSANLNDELTIGDVAQSGVEGGVYGGLGIPVAAKIIEPAIKAIGNVIDPILSKFMNANKEDFKSSTLGASSSDSHVYDPATKKIQQLQYVTPKVPENGIELQAQVDGAMIEKEVPIVPLKTQLSDETLAAFKLNKDDKILQDQDVHDAMLRAQHMHENGFKLDDIPRLQTSVINEIQAHYAQKIDDLNKSLSTEKTKFGFMKSIYDHMSNLSNNVAVRHAIGGEFDNLIEADIKSGTLYNTIVSDIQKEAKVNATELGKELGEIQGYIPQEHNPNRLRLVSPDEFANDYEPRGQFRANPETGESSWTKQDLKNMYNNITVSDYQSFGSVSGINSNKSRMWFFNTVKDALEMSDKYSYKKSAGTYLNDLINRHSTEMALTKIIGRSDTNRVLGYLGQLQGQSEAKIKNILSTLERSASYQHDTVSNAIGTIMNATTALSRGVKAIVQPLAITGFYAKDVYKTMAYTYGKYGNIKEIVKGIFGKIPEGLEQMANLPNHHQETFKNIFQTLKETGRNDLMHSVGIGRDAQQANKYISAVNRASLKLSGAHVLDAPIRRLSTRASAFALREEYKQTGLKNFLPKVNQEILKQAIDKNGFIDPYKILNLANNTNNPALKRQYMDTFHQLAHLYSSVINDINPIYSNGLNFLNKAHPITAALTRPMAWALRSQLIPYGQLVKQLIGGQNKTRAGSAIVAMAFGDAALTMATEKIFEYLKGEPDYKNKFQEAIKSIDNTLGTSIQDDDDLSLAVEFMLRASETALPTIAIQNSTLWYGPAKHATQGTINYIKGDDYKGDKELEKAFPYWKIYLNMWGS